MLSNVPTINQAGVSALLKERLEHPDQYIDRPLVIWNSDFFDGIMRDLALTAVRKFNHGKPKEQWKGWWLNPKRAVKKERLALSIITHDVDFSVSLKQYPVPTVMFAPFEEPQAEILAKLPGAEQYIFHDPTAVPLPTSTFRKKFSNSNNKPKTNH